MEAGPGLVMLAGTITFGNEWYQTGKPNWRVPVATLLGTWLVGGIDKVSPKTATALGAMILIGAMTTKFGGKSPVQELTAALNGTGKLVQPKKGK